MSFNKIKIEALTFVLLFLSISAIFSQNEILVAEAEAENADLFGVNINNSIPGYSGTGYVTGLDEVDDKFIFTVYLPEQNFYTLVIRYNGSNGAKSQKLSINNRPASSVWFPETESWENLEAGKFLLEEGENTITIIKDWGWTHFDKIEVYQAEKNVFNIANNLVDENATEETRNLYEFLKLQFGYRMISGQTTSYFTELKEIAGATPIINNDDFSNYTEGYPYKWDNGHVFGAVDDGRVNRMIQWYKSTNTKGIVAFQWHWHSPSGGQPGNNNFYTDNTSFDIREAVKEGTEEYNLIIRDIDAIAAQLKKFDDEKIPVIFRPLHEAGGGWFWWGAKGPEPCKKLYDLIFDRIKNHHQLHNIIWVWSTPETDWYPGNDKVDIIGYDSYPGEYNYTTQKPMFDKLFSLTKGEKLIAMTENGPIPDPDECFVQDAPWLWFMSWDKLVESQNTSEHIQQVFDNNHVITLESNNARTDNLWRSSLYPEDWSPGYSDGEGRFLHDFSYAGYHQGEKEIPFIENNLVDVTQPPYNADNKGRTEVTSIIQQALDEVGQMGGGVVYLPAGMYLVNPGNNESALRIKYSNTIIRGAGTDSTFLLNNTTSMREKSIIWLMGDWCTWANDSETTTKLKSDLLYPTRIIPVESVEEFQEGDNIILRTDGTQAFIEEHNMAGVWEDWAARVMFLREIDSIDAKNNLIYIDSPTRYFMKKRDNARIYKAKEHIVECGVENLSIGNIQSEKAGWDEEAYSTPGNGAYDVHASYAICVKYAQNCWIKNVNTYQPDTNSDDFHLLSNGILLDQSRNITVDSCFFQKPQYEGGGGNGYMFTLSSNDCLIKNCRGNDSRHNYDFKFPHSNGNVIYNCIGENSKYASDFHMYLSMSNLIDNFSVDKDYLESTFRPYGGSVVHGYTSTQSVFYNTKGLAYHPNKQYIIESKQFGNGYVIGTSGEATKVMLDPVQGTVNGYSYNSSPRDFVEGIGTGVDLYPHSLYLDQLKKRMQANTSLPKYKVTINIIQSDTEEPLSDCQIQLLNQQKITDGSGKAVFNSADGLLIIDLAKENFFTQTNKQILIYSDTTLTFRLVPEEYNVTISVHDNSTGQIFEGVPITFSNTNEVTNSLGEAYFTVPGGTFEYSVNKQLFENVSGTVEIKSDTTIYFYLVRTNANIKFKLTEENSTTPINKATIILGNDTLITSALGIANFRNLLVDTTYSYLISKGGYVDVTGNLYLKNDTTVNLELIGYPTVSGAVNDNKFRIWPNPANNEITVQLPDKFINGNIEILDANGEILKKIQIKSGNKISIFVNDLSSGIYLLKAESDNIQFRRVFIKI